MTPDLDRRYALAAIVVLLGILTGIILLEVLATILFAITVAFVLVPVQRWLVRRGLGERLAAIGATLVGFLGALAVFAPIFVTVYYRIDELEALIRSVPDEIPITAFGETVTVESALIQDALLDVVGAFAVAFVWALPELVIKFALFVLLLFALLLKGRAAAKAAVAPVPPAYRDVVAALATRAQETLYAIYVLQVATGIATLLIGYPLFLALGYDVAFTLAMIAAILQFVPIIGPSLLILPLAGYEVLQGDIAAAILVGVLGVGLIAWFPDVYIRPKLAYRSAGLPGSLYFVGFTGGLFTMGPIGIVIGPLIVAVFVEAVELLADEVHARELERYEPIVAEFALPESEPDASADDGERASYAETDVLDPNE
ncbi:AI-2E family transporter [Halovivax gelatinilyticus]|uniref:AI-2E family transporter n=1 Tax=Halovivax gelatinilyticus TaxID=2961597 RepID=UPI0020CA81AE|nr:AI-2E family transporter [Halovivax gelatinilyticus]